MNMKDEIPGTWLERRTHNPMIACLSLTGASNILGQDMNLVNA